MFIRVRTEQEADILLGFLHKKGYRWSNGEGLLSMNHWNVYKEKTCYFITGTKCISYGEQRNLFEVTFKEFKTIILNREEANEYTVTPV